MLDKQIQLGQRFSPHAIILTYPRLENTDCVAGHRAISEFLSRNMEGFPSVKEKPEFGTHNLPVVKGLLA